MRAVYYLEFKASAFMEDSVNKILTAFRLPFWQARCSAKRNKTFVIDEKSTKYGLRGYPRVDPPYLTDAAAIEMKSSQPSSG